jgi:hypothetical protein
MQLQMALVENKKVYLQTSWSYLIGPLVNTNLAHVVVGPTSPSIQLSMSPSPQTYNG